MSVFIIAEVGQAHDGSLGILHSYIDVAAKIGVDAVKFQTHIAEAESSQFEPFRVNFSYVDKTRFDYWERVSFDKEQWREIKDHCDEVGVEFMSSPFSVAAVDLLSDIGMNKFKIGSGEVTNLLMLDAICSSRGDVLLSSGMSSFNELDKAVEKIRSSGNNLSVLQCTSKYPTLPKDVGLNMLNTLAARYQVPVGLSDHSGTIYPSIAAVALGATVVEAHIVFDKQMFGPDSTSSLTVAEFAQMVEGVRNVSEMLSNPLDKKSSDFESMKGIFEKSLSVNKTLEKGAVIKLDDLESKKPKGMGISSADYLNVVGKKVNKKLEKWDFIKEGDLSG